jgi:hypothetical protein
MDVAGDATFAGATVNTGGNISIDAGGDVNMLATQDYNYTATSSNKRGFLNINSKSGNSETSTTINQTTKINSGGNLSLSASNDINLIGTKADANGNVNLTAGNDINIFSAVDKYSYNNTSSGKKLWGLAEKTMAINKKEKLTNKKSEINASGNFTATSGSNINVIGGTISTYDGNINAGDQFNLFSVQDYDYTYDYEQKKSIDWFAAIGQAVVGAVGTALSGGSALAIVGAGAVSGGTMLLPSSHKMEASEYERLAITQVKSELNFENKFESYSGNDTTIISSNIIAKNPNSKIETGKNGGVVIADLYNEVKSLETIGRYSPYIRTGGGGTIDSDIVGKPDISGMEKMAKDIVIDISNLGDYIGSKIGGWIGKQIIKNTSESKLSDRIMGLVLGQANKFKLPGQSKHDELIGYESGVDFWTSPETRTTSQIEEFCGDKCKYDQTPIHTLTPVNSVIKFGE